MDAGRPLGTLRRERSLVVQRELAQIPTQNNKLFANLFLQKFVKTRSNRGTVRANKTLLT